MRTCHCVRFVVIRLIWARTVSGFLKHRLGIVEAPRVKIYAVFSVSARSTMYRTCSFTRIQLHLQNDCALNMPDHLPVINGLIIKACMKPSRDYLFPCSPEINCLLPLVPNFKIIYNVPCFPKLPLCPCSPPFQTLCSLFPKIAFVPLFPSFSDP